MRRFFLASAIFLVASSTLLGVSTGAATVSARSLALLARADAQKMPSVHEIVINRSATSGQLNYVDVNDVSQDGALQDFSGGASNGIAFREIAIAPSRVVYFNANATTLANTVFHLSATGAASDANHWIRVLSSNGYYPSLAAGTTIRSDFEINIVIAGTITLNGIGRTDGQTVRHIVINAPASTSTPALDETLDVTLGAHPLPVHLGATGSGVSLSVDWTKWGEKVSLARPPSHITFN